MGGFVRIFEKPVEPGDHRVMERDEKKMNTVVSSAVKGGMIGLLLVTVLMGGGYLYLTWNAPLGPTLEPQNQNENSQQAPPEIPTQEMTEQGTLDPPNPTPGVTPTPTIQPVCGGPPSMTILLSGVASEGYLYGLADAIRVVRLDFQTKTISVLTFPRDMWVDIPGIADHGVTQGKLNQAYFYGTEGMGYFDGSGYGSGLLAKTLQDNFGMQIDHFLAVNLFAFRNIVNTMGGIDVYFAEPVYIKKFEQPKLYLEAGQHHLNGKQAENVVRTRITIGDFGRIRNQTVVIKAVAAKLISPGGIQTIPSIVQQVKSSVLTDLSPAEISQMVCLAEKIDPREDILFYEIPAESLREDRVYDSFLGYRPYVLLYEEQEIRQMVTSFLQGEGF